MEFIHHLDRSLLQLRPWHAWLVLLLGMLASGMAGWHVKGVLEREALRQFSFVCDQISLKLSERLEAYALILGAASACSPRRAASTVRNGAPTWPSCRPSAASPGCKAWALPA